MTVRLLRFAHREVVRPLLRTKHDVVRSALSVLPGVGRPSRASSSAPTRDSGTTDAAAPVPSVATRAKARQKQVASTSTKTPATPKKVPAASKKTASTDARTKAELYEEATRRDIAGRSKMTKAELLEALRSA